ncbi:MAG: MarR family winged helix-turn-helix transcriptional regulator [Nocardioidaceae bacterium]
MTPIQVIARIGRLRGRFHQELADLFARYDLTAADFAVIAALRRSGEPYELSQSALMQRLGLTSGTVSVRLNRLEVKDAVTRTSHPSDARGSLVQLTPKGVDLFAEVAPAHLTNEEVLLSALTDPERDTLAHLLRKLLNLLRARALHQPAGLPGRACA